MDNIKSAVDNLPTAKVNASDNPVDHEDKQAILPTELASLSRKHSDCLLQIRVTGQQRTDWGVQAKDRNATREHIPPMLLTQQQRQNAGKPP